MQFCLYKQYVLLISLTTTNYGLWCTWWPLVLEFCFLFFKTLDCPGKRICHWKSLHFIIKTSSLTFVMYLNSLRTCACICDEQSYVQFLFSWLVSGHTSRPTYNADDPAEHWIYLVGLKLLDQWISTSVPTGIWWLNRRRLLLLFWMPLSIHVG